MASKRKFPEEEKQSKRVKPNMAAKSLQAAIPAELIETQLKSLKSLKQMKKLLLEHGIPSEKFTVGSVVQVNNKMQSNYFYTLQEPIGENFHPEFKPYFSPKRMLELGIFEGKYLNDCIFEYPKEWFEEALDTNKLSPGGPRVEVNYFLIKSRLPLCEWKNKNWIWKEDPRGWFEWYCRYYLGRRRPEMDLAQIKRWKSFRRHEGGVKKNCAPGDLNCRPKQRQALLHWSYDPFV